MRLPSSRTSPANAGSSPMIVLSIVDLPAPLRPSSATTSPAAIWSCTSNRTCARPYPPLTCSISSIAKVHLAHSWIVAYCSRRPAGYDFSAVQHEHTVCEGEHRFHVMLGKQHGDVLVARQCGNETHERVALLRRRAGRRLVHQQQARAVGQCEGKLQALEVAVRQLRADARGLLRHSDPSEQLVRFVNAKIRGRLQKGTEQPVMREQRHLHVLAHAHRSERRGHLKSSAYTEPPNLARRHAKQARSIEGYVSHVRRQLAVDDVEAGRLAGAVWPDHR